MLGVFLSLLAAVAVVKVYAADTCPDLYRRYSTKHSYCLPPNRQCQILDRGVNSQEKAEILRVHNELRSKIAMGLEPRAGGMPKATDMMELIWDQELADVAQKWSEQCDFNHDCGPCKKVQAFSVGQNLGLGRNGGYLTPGGRGEWKEFLENLYDEVKSPAFHNYMVDKHEAGPPPLHPDQFGHFTQLIWAKSWRVGCGWTLYDKGRGRESYLACNYGPGGNVLDQKIYTKGDVPCSACPSNTCCGRSCQQHGITAKYDGLCKVVNPWSPPLPIDNRRYLFYCDFMKFGFDSDCSTIVSDRLWNLVMTPGGNWNSVVLRGGQSTKLVFYNKFHSPGYVCGLILARGGPNDASQRYGLNVKLVLKETYGTGTSDLSSAFGQLDNDNRQNFMIITIPSQVQGEVQISFEVSVPFGSDDQFFEIKKIAFSEPVNGVCPSPE